MPKSTMAKVVHKASLRKQLEWVAVLVFVFIMLGVALYPVNTPQKRAYFAFVLVLFAIFVIRNVRRLAKAAVCPACGVDLYEVIQASRFKRQAFRHCPSCGAPIEV